MAEEEKGKILYGMFSDISDKVKDKIMERIKKDLGDNSRLSTAIAECFEEIMKIVDLDKEVAAVIVDLFNEELKAEISLGYGEDINVYYGLIDFEYYDDELKSDGFDKNPIKKRVSIINLVKNHLEDKLWANSKNIFAMLQKDLEYCASLCKKIIEEQDDPEENNCEVMYFEREYGNFWVKDKTARLVDSFEDGKNNIFKD